MNKLISLIFILPLTISCATLRTNNLQKASNAELYYQSITNAMAPDSSKIYYDLVDITKTNELLEWNTIQGEDYIRMVTWKKTVSYYEPYLDSLFYNTGKYEIWVTASPQLLNRMKTKGYNDADLRLKQLLGLPPQSEYNYFVEFWVKPSDLMRPCPDNEITDKTCELCFPSTSTDTHQNWINENRISRYYNCELENKYPWTQLGYTYDWNPNNLTHVGLSEFVIKENADIKVYRIVPTQEYLKQD